MPQFLSHITFVCLDSAATGLPYLQEAHAAIMAKFADDCLRKVDEITKHLADTLGEDTTLLQLRVGIHSGTVTGGCLRGQKARFQLFGDTMVRNIREYIMRSERGKLTCMCRTPQAAWKATESVERYSVRRRQPLN